MANMWWGAPGHEPLHMDVTDGTLCQHAAARALFYSRRRAGRTSSILPVIEYGHVVGILDVLAQPDFERFRGLPTHCSKRWS